VQLEGSGLETLINSMSIQAMTGQDGLKLLLAIVRQLLRQWVMLRK